MWKRSHFKCNMLVVVCRLLACVFAYLDEATCSTSFSYLKNILYITCYINLICILLNSRCGLLDVYVSWYVGLCIQSASGLQHMLTCLLFYFVLIERLTAPMKGYAYKVSQILSIYIVCFVFIMYLLNYVHTNRQLICRCFNQDIYQHHEVRGIMGSRRQPTHL